MPAQLPSLSTSGWVTGVAETADRLMAYFFTSDYSQSNLYRGKISSLPYLIQQHGNDELAIAEKTQNTLEALLGKYFDQVDLSVTTDTPRREDPHRINLRIDATVVKNNTSYSLGRLIQILNGKMTEIIHLNN